MKIRLHSVSLSAHVESGLTSAQNSGWTYKAMAQIYKTPNDHLMFFFEGSGARTIQLRVPSKSIKIHNGHPAGSQMDASVRETVGFVSEAHEFRTRMEYLGFISKTEEEIADKIADETITQNSMEISVLKSEPKPVDIDTVPEHARRFASLDSDGKAVMLGVREYMWRHIGLVSGSSQDVPAILEPPVMVMLSGLPVSSTPWPSDAEASLSEWAGIISRQGADPVPNYAKLAAGHLAQFADDQGDFVFAGQFAAPDEAGELVVHSAAIHLALQDLRDKLESSTLAPDSRTAVMDSAWRRVRPYMVPAASRLTAEQEPAIHISAAADTAPGNLIGTGNPTVEGAQEPQAALSQIAPGSAAMSPTAGSEEAGRKLAEDAHLELMNLCDEVSAPTEGGTNGKHAAPSRRPE